MTFARVLGGIGRTLITSGVVILLFVAYQLWGTGIAEARAQNKLESEFTAVLEQAGVVETVLPVSASAVDGSIEAIRFGRTAPPPPPEDGSSVAQMRIPRINVDKVVVEGVGRGDLKDGPGHYPDSPLPGQPGNASIAGHRTTYGAPFFRLDELEVGDQIFVTTLQGQFEYRVITPEFGTIEGAAAIVRPSNVGVLEEFGDNRLTLTTCHPRYSASRRLIIVAELIGEAAEPSAPRGDTLTGTLAVNDGFGEGLAEEAELVRESIDEELGGDPTAREPAFLWGLAAAMAAFWFWLLGHFWKKWPSYVMGSPVVLILLFIFFENFSRLLPANF